MFTVAEILEVLPGEGSLEVKKLEKALKLTKKNERHRLEIALKALAKLGLVQVDELSNIRLSALNSSIAGRIRCSTKGYCFVVRDDGEEDIYIRDRYLNQALHGDRVLVKIHREGLRRRSPEGIILCILERSNTNILASIYKENEHYYAKPLDERLLTRIIIDPKTVVEDYTEQNNNIVEVSITQYPIAQLEAKGELVKKLSLNKGIDGDLEIIKTKYNIRNLTESPKSSLKKPSSKKRIDLTSQKTLLFKSWELNSSPCLPAINVIPKKGGFILTVHVPCISERINITGKLNNWMSNIGESFCTSKEWNNLLSNQLLEQSNFQVGIINEAVSLDIEVSKSGEIINWNFYNSLIKPVAEIKTDHLEVINKRKSNSRITPSKLKPIKDHIKHIESILFAADLLSKTRLNKREINLNRHYPDIEYLNDLKFIMPGKDINGWNDSVKLTDPNSVLNQFINLANTALYIHLSDYGIPLIRYSDSSIDKGTYNEIIKAATVLDSHIELDEEGMIMPYDLLQSLEHIPNKRIIEKLLKNSIHFKSLVCENINTDSRDIPNYNNNSLLKLSETPQAPWCCPALSYADILNQYVLVNLLLDGKDKANSKSKEIINLGTMNSSNDLAWSPLTEEQLIDLKLIFNEKLIASLNSIRTRLDQFRNGIISMAQARSVQSIIGKNIEGLITGVQSYGVFVEIPPHMAEGLVHVSSLDDDWYEYRSRQNMLIGRKSKRTYQLGQSVNVKVTKVDLLRNQIDLEINENETDKATKEIEL